MTAVVYARYSSDNQREESITAQLRAIRAYSEKENIKIVREYIDEAKSAKSDNRPDFLRMIDELTAGQITADCVLVHKLDRFARNRYDSAIYRKKLKDKGMRLIAVSQPMDNSPESVILESMLEAMAEYYSLNLGREASKGLRENAHQGIHTGGTPPLGYDIEPGTKKYIINENESIIVKLIYNMTIAGDSYGKIIEVCNNRGYRTKKNKPFGKNSIHDILRNEKYTGTFIFNKLAGSHDGHKYRSRDEWIIIEDALPVIISKKRWGEVQELMNGRKANTRRNSGDRTYLLTGKIVCGECGGAYVGSRGTSKNGDKHYYYICSAKKRLGTCKNTSINADYLERWILDEIDEKCFPKSSQKQEQLINKLEMIYKQKNKSDTEEKEYIKNKMVQINTKIDRFINAFENGTITDELAGSRLKTLKIEKDSLQARMNEIENQSPALTREMIKTYLQYNMEVLAQRTSPEECLRLINSLVIQVAITPEKGNKESRIRVSLKYNVFGYNGSPRGHLELSEHILRKDLYRKYKNKP